MSEREGIEGPAEGEGEGGGEGTGTDQDSMPLVSHLRELRHRVVVSVVAITVAFTVCYTFSEALFDLLAAPLLPALPEGERSLAFTGVVEPFFTYLKVGLVGALITASPVILYQGWAFIAPGLYEGERAWLPLVVAVSVLLFASGVTFAYMIVLPVGFKYLLSFSGPELRPVLSMGLYLSFATKLLVAFGVIFQIPLAALVFSRLGLVDARGLVAFWKYAFLLAVIVGAFLTPPDIFSQLLMAGPIMLLYGISIVVVMAFGKKMGEGGETLPDEEDEGEGEGSD
ncbi:MAG: twin-arginine translocase subunit TatC, partial [Thermodesulfobacteriota bacterium]